MAMFRASNYLLAEIERHLPAPILHVDLSNHKPSSQLIVLFMKDCIRGIIECKSYHSLGLVKRSLLQ